MKKAKKKKKKKYQKKIIIIKKIKIKKKNNEFYKVNESACGSRKFKEFLKKSKIEKEDENKLFDNTPEEKNNDISVKNGLKRINSNFDMKYKEKYMKKISGEIYDSCGNYSLNIKNNNKDKSRSSISKESIKKGFNNVIKSKKDSMDYFTNCTYMSLLKKNRNLHKTINFLDNKKYTIYY